MRQDVLTWAHSLGFSEIPEPRFDGEFIRFGEKKSSWFVAREFSSSTDSGKQYYAATLGDWKSGEIYHFQNQVRLKPSEKSQVKEFQENYRIRIARERDEAYDQAAYSAKVIYDKYASCDTHPYLEKKRISAGPGVKSGDEYLVIPLKDVNGKLWSFQRIYPNSDKRFFPGGRVKGSFYQFGEMTDQIYICEGYATGFSVYKKFGSTVICAMSAGNIPAVAESLKAKYKKAQFIYAADRDEHSKGEEMCKKAMKITGGMLILPPDGFKDFNDAQDTELVPIEDQEMILGSFTDTTGGKNQKPLHTIRNLVELLTKLKIVVRYNLIGKKEEILIPGHSFTIDNQSNASLAYIVSIMKSVQMPTGSVLEFLTYIADQNIYNPVATWILSKPWDGVDRLSEMYQTVTCTNEPQDGMLKEILMKRWFVSAVAGAFEPNGLSAHGMLVFQGTQSLGKTYWFKKLVPEGLKLRKDGLILKPDDRDSVKQAISYWLVELGELDGTFNRSDIAQLKSFMTAENDVMRLSYARKESDFARRTVFFGSVNSDKFLVDNTGNRRFWAIECSAIDYLHKIDMQQFWAQIHALYVAGEPWVLQPDELAILNESNQKFETIDPVEEMLQTTYDWNSEQRFWEWKTATKIAYEIGKKDPKKGDVNSISRLVKRMNKDQSKHNGIGRVLFCPKPISQ